MNWTSSKIEFEVDIIQLTYSYPLIFTINKQTVNNWGIADYSPIACYYNDNIPNIFFLK